MFAGDVNLDVRQHRLVLAARIQEFDDRKAGFQPRNILPVQGRPDRRCVRVLAARIQTGDVHRADRDVQPESGTPDPWTELNDHWADRKVWSQVPDQAWWCSEGWTSGNWEAFSSGNSCSSRAQDQVIFWHVSVLRRQIQTDLVREVSPYSWASCLPGLASIAHVNISNRLIPNKWIRSPLVQWLLSILSKWVFSSLDSLALLM